MNKPIFTLSKTAFTVLNNIKRYRAIKSISSKSMAYQIDMTPSEYSKLENGTKKNWEHWLPKILTILGVNHFDIMQEEKSEGIGFLSSQKIEILNKENENLKKLIQLFDEKNRIRDEFLQSKNQLISNQKEEIIYWKGKYIRCKERLEKTENENVILKTQIKHETKNKRTKNTEGLTNLGGGFNVI
jgi:transcriptional regulator with XRE-family HTH domain